SGTRDNAGSWHVEPAELFRVFEPAPEQEQSEPQPAQPDALIAELRARLDEMRGHIADIRQERDRTIERLDRDIADLRHERDEWREAFKRLSLPAPGASGAAPDTADLPTMQQGRGDAGQIFPANDLMRDAAGPAPAPDAAQPSRLRRAWRWMRATG